jgi:hypothetical protein
MVLSELLRRLLLGLQPDLPSPRGESSCGKDLRRAFLRGLVEIVIWQSFFARSLGPGLSADPIRVGLHPASTRYV